MKATDSGQWWIAWDRKRHTLTWRYGKITGPFHPVDIWGLRYYAAHNFCQVFPRIHRREWDHLLNKVRFAHVAVCGQSFPADGTWREVVPTSMVAAGDEFYQVVTEDVFGKTPEASGGMKSDQEWRQKYRLCKARDGIPGASGTYPRRELRILKAEILGEPVFQFTVSREDKCLLFAWGWATNLKNVAYIQWLIFYWRWPFVRYIEEFKSRD